MALPAGPDLSVTGCRDYFQAVGERIGNKGVGDGGYARIAGFPYLRVDRFLAGFRHRALSEAGFQAWVDRLGQRAEAGFAVELANGLPLQEKTSKIKNRLRRCGTLLRHHDLAHAKGRNALRLRAVVAPEYRDWQRIVGLYPLTVWPMQWGVSRLHDRVRKRYQIPLAALPVRGERVRYAPPRFVTWTAAGIGRMLADSARNPLAIPEPTGAEKERLFATFAPVWVVDTQGRDDRIGTPGWRFGVSHPLVDTGRPVTYRYLSHTRFHGDILLQLNYVIWFPARPLTASWDLLGGRLDGITWRVTLGRDGTPLIYDAMHNCGCFHYFFPHRAFASPPREQRTVRTGHCSSDRTGVDARRLVSAAYIQHRAPIGTGQVGATNHPGGNALSVGGLQRPALFESIR